MRVSSKTKFVLLYREFRAGQLKYVVKKDMYSHLGADTPFCSCSLWLDITCFKRQSHEISRYLYYEKQCWKIRGHLYFKILLMRFKRPGVSLLVRSKKYQKASESHPNGPRYSASFLKPACCLKLSNAIQ
jgi:hypothetical protein